jgi:hypothetical protein
MRRLIYCTIILLALCLLAFTQSATFPGLNGLGSSTMTCVDRDGDGYGTGPGCTGPDADDLDATVRTGAQAISKYGTLSAFLAHQGYTPTRIWYIAKTGNDATCVSGGAPVGIGSPCATFFPVDTNLAAGDMVIYRTGTYLESGRFVPRVNGTSSRPIIALAYPGEAVTIDTAATSASNVDVIDRSYITVDGFKVTHGYNSGCISGGSSAGTAPNTFHHNTFRHIEATACIWGLIASGLDDVLIEDSVFYNNLANGGQHGIYIGARYNTLSSNITIRRIITYNNGYTGIQVNGNVANLVQDQNIAYGNLIANYSWENGVHNSFFRSNLSFNWGTSGGLVISEYNGNEGMQLCGTSGNEVCVCSPTPNQSSTCAHDQTGNLIENFTSYGTTNASDGTSVAGVPAISVALQNRSTACTTPTCQGADLGHNTFRNIIAVTYGLADHYPPIIFNDDDKTYLATSTFSNILIKQSDSGNGSAAIGFGLNKSSFGFNAYSCAAAATITTISNCINADPQFVASSPTYSNSPSSFNFRLSPTSPAVRTGTTAGIPAYDLFGNPFASTPSMGAIEQAQSSSSTPPTVSITAPSTGSTVSGTVTVSVSATASGTLSVAGVQLQVDGTNLGSPVTIGPVYTVSWDTTKYANGLHTLTAIATDSGGNTGTASVSVTINNAVAAPVISGVTAGSITASTASIGWTTDKASDSQVAYGTTADYGLTSSLGTTLVTAHVVILSSLSPSTTYHFKVLSRDGQGNLAGSADFTFTTAPASRGTGWQQLTNTSLKSVCPANSFGGINYAFADKCGAVITAWNGAVADTTRNRLIIWGGGHGDYSGNEVYSLNLGTASPTMTRLTNPSDFTQNSGCLDSNVVDGTPVSRHTYSGIVYLPVQDQMFSFGGSPAPCGGFSGRTYTLDLSQATPTWRAMDPVNGYNPTSVYWTGSAICGYDPNTQTVICTSSDIFLRYNPATNTYTRLSSDQHVPYAASGVIDTKRKRFVFMGVEYESSTPRVVAVDLSSGSSFTAQDWSSQVTGCDALAGASYPGLIYDPVLDRIVGWPNAGNTVYLFDPDQKTCTAQTFPNGPSNTLASTTGTFGRFQYFPGWNAYAVVSSATLDAYKLTLSETAPVRDPCDVNNDGLVNSADVQAAINQSLGITPCGTAALRQAGQCNVIDVQRVIVAALGGTCRTGQ